MIERTEKIDIKDMTIWRLGEQIVEVIAAPGIDASGEHIKELWATVREMNPQPVAIMINRENDYSVQFSVFIEATKNNPFKYVAMVNNGRARQFFPESLWPKFLKHRIFNQRDSALEWLEQKLTQN